MTPKDWNEIKKLLEPVADQETVDAILTKLNSGVTVGFRKPIKMISTSTTQTQGTVSGTGKGILFITYESASSDYGFSVTIDGISLGKLSESRNNTATVFFEFTTSFSVTYKNYGSVNAIFY